MACTSAGPPLALPQPPPSGHKKQLEPFRSVSRTVFSTPFSRHFESCRHAVTAGTPACSVVTTCNSAVIIKLVSCGAVCDLIGIMLGGKTCRSGKICTIWSQVMMKFVNVIFQ